MIDFTEEELVEIYYSIESKLKGLKNGDLGNPKEALIKKWVAVLEEIKEKISNEVIV